MKLSKYANDAQIVLDGSANIIRNVVKLLDSDTEIGGLKLNYKGNNKITELRTILQRESQNSYNRSELAPLGKSKMEICSHSFSPTWPLFWITIPTNGNTERLIRYNFEETKEKIKSIVRSWGKRNLALYGKVTVIKCSIIS